jgi:hypothetical protein
VTLTVLVWRNYRQTFGICQAPLAGLLSQARTKNTQGSKNLKE